MGTNDIDRLQSVLPAAAGKEIAKDVIDVHLRGVEHGITAARDVNVAQRDAIEFDVRASDAHVVSGSQSDRSPERSAQQGAARAGASGREAGIMLRSFPRTAPERL